MGRRMRQLTFDSKPVFSATYTILLKTGNTKSKPNFTSQPYRCLK